MMRILGWVTIATLLWGVPAAAAPLVTLIPSDGIIVAEPGETVGWGYEIVNDDPLNWLVVWGLGSDAFAHGTITNPLDIFDFPIVAPNSMITVPYVAGDDALYEFTWDGAAPDGFVNSGTFVISADLYDGDPFLGGQFLSVLPDFELAYEARVAAPPPPTTVPEPGTLLLFSSGIVIAGWSRRRKLT